MSLPDPPVIMPVGSDGNQKAESTEEWLQVPSVPAEFADIYSAGYVPSEDSVVIPSPRSGGASFEATVTHAIIAYWGLATPSIRQFDTRAIVFYNIACAFGGRTWNVHRRYTDFVGLHEGLKRLVKSQGSSSGLPSLPRSSFFRRTNASKTRIEQRRNALAAYVARLLATAQGNAGVRVQFASFLTATGYQPPLPPPLQEGYPGCPPSVVRSVFQLPRSTNLPGLALALPWALGGGYEKRLLIVTPRIERTEFAHRKAEDFRALYQWAGTLGDEIPSQDDVSAFLSYRLSQHRQPSPHTVHLRCNGRAEDAMLGAYEHSVLDLPKRDHSSVRVCNFVRDGHDFPISCTTPGGCTMTISLDPPPGTTLSPRLDSEPPEWNLRLPIPIPGHERNTSCSASCSGCSPTSSVGHWSDEVVSEGAAAACRRASISTSDDVGLYKC